MFLRIVNSSIAVLLIAFLALVYWFGWRTLPEISGTIAAPISAAATITRDAQGVPHIRAASSDDALFLEGYAMAQDRLWQMDALRRQAAGELAEVAGAAAFASDQEAHSLGIERIAEQQEGHLAPGERAAFTAFARGVNRFIETHRSKLPMEFAVMGYDPRPWRVRDSLLAGMAMYRTLTASWRAELNKQQMLAQGERAKVEYLLPPNNGNDPQPGSNAWVISGAHTANGKPILANDPHLIFSLPSPWYLVHLEAPDLHVAGATIVGLPGVIIGHNQNIAWGVTNLEFDVQDLYHEQIDMQTGRYRFQNTIEQAHPYQDVVAVKGAQPSRFNTWITRHGPLFLNEGGQQFALHWTAADPGGFTFPFLDMDRARNWEEFRTALSRYGGPGQNFVYADTQGHIGYQAAGHLPIRKTCAGDVPTEGSTGECEWDGYIPFDDLPRAYDPPSGMFVTANQDTFKRNPAYKINGNFGAPYRARQIEARLSAREQWKAEEMLGVQTDVYSAFGAFLAREIVAAFDRAKPNQPLLANSVDTLRNWNGVMGKQQAAPMVVMLVFAQLQKLAAERAAPGAGAKYEGMISALAIERLLKEKPQDWFPDYDQVLMRCLTGAVEVGRKTQGSQIASWQWGQYQPLTITHPVGSRLPLLGRYFNIGPAPVGGAPTTVAQHTGNLGPSLRMAVDLGDLEHSYINLATGESDQRLSMHYSDQWDAYYAGRSFPMQFGKVDGDKVLNVQPGE